MQKVKRTYKVIMKTYMYDIVEAENKDEAIDIAIDRDMWLAPIGQGYEDYEVKELEI